MKRVAINLFCLIVFFCAGVFLLLVQPGPSGVVASLRLEDGSEYMVTQQCNWSVEPYSIAFYLRPAGGDWGWCYMDHQASRWRNVKLTYDSGEDVITVTKGGIWQASLDRERNLFAIGDGKPRRALLAPQAISPPRYPFP